MDEKLLKDSQHLTIPQISMEFPEITNTTNVLDLLCARLATISIFQDQADQLEKRVSQVTAYLSDEFHENFSKAVHAECFDYPTIRWEVSTTHMEILQSQTEEQNICINETDEHLCSQFKTQFDELIRHSDFEFGFSSAADHYVLTAIKQYGPFAREWINDIFLKNFDDPPFLTGLLRVIAHFDYTDMYPQGMTMATAALLHKDVEIRDCAVRCFESWEDPENLKILKNLSFSEYWLSEYLNEVISYLEDLQQNAPVH